MEISPLIRLGLSIVFMALRILFGERIVLHLKKLPVWQVLVIAATSNLLGKLFCLRSALARGLVILPPDARLSAAFLHFVQAQVRQAQPLLADRLRRLYGDPYPDFDALRLDFHVPLLGRQAILGFATRGLAPTFTGEK
jgi:hypothetical protein